MTDLTPEHQEDVAAQSPVSPPPAWPPPGMYAQQTIGAFPPTVADRMNEEHITQLIDRLAESGIDSQRHQSNRLYAVCGVILVALCLVGALLMFGRPDTVPVVKELLTHGAALLAGVLGGIGIIKAKQE